ncbi:MAG: TrkH family potassium uptake protein [Prevotella sp.]|nr:TrkH family potassium uptake protein [Prevotella sp.]
MFNKKLISKVIGSLLVLEAAFMLLCVVTALFYRSSDAWPFIFSFLITLGAGVGLVRLGLGAPTTMTRRDAYIVVTFTWVTFSIFGSLPYLFGGFFGTFSFFDLSSQIAITTDAFFETMSGFTTTGASMLNDVEAQLDSHHAMLAWRSLSQWIGGLGIVFFTIAILPSMVGNSMKVFSAEATGPIRSKMHPRLSATAMRIWWVYILLTVGCGVCYALAGMDGFSAVNYAMTTTATGGFSIHNDSIAHFHSPTIEYIAIVFQFLAGINFSMLFMVMAKRKLNSWREFKRSEKSKWSEFLANEETRFFILAVTCCTLVIALILMFSNGYALETAFRKSLFQVVSLMTTTGIFCDHVGAWPHITWMILYILMFVGACSGSTTGGFKSSRALMIIKVIRNEFVRMMHPRAVLPVKLNGKAMPSQIVNSLLASFSIYILVCLGTIALMMAIDIDITNSAIISISCLSNVGLPLNELGPDMTWSSLPIWTKWVCTVLMLLGRLEIFNVLILFTTPFWEDS